MRLLRSTALLLALSISPALAVVNDPPGNRSKTQPPIDMSSIKRVGETKESFEGKYQKIYALLKRDKNLIRSIKKSAAQYGIDPIHMIGAIVGEHTYNVGGLDSAQAYYVKGLAYLGTKDLAFGYAGISIASFVARPEFADCNDLTTNYDLWTCRENVWDSTFRGKRVDGVSYPRDRFSKVFFQPLFAGQTFGLGQINPLTALTVTDIVHRKSGLPLLDMDKAPEVYQAIMDPDISLDYMAAIIRLSIDVYRDTAGVDISDNPGITATLYNIGDVKVRARTLAAARKRNKAAWPEENYYGWLINEREDELRKLL
ncbi:DUF1402 family protein [Kaistia dalseonensis]|uniref:DUF1402 family protein n=2 Tax=Kaistia dalseonensis TaxID=410840 RepID=A0ABU0H550_9HYPH|nr:DUF1402 family protein [Kaistia dalseonensis]MCX5494850.1 DUF1402 family protein [Kaistia dalseonensis]MDQ0437431.1 hypothetical protein [Kaistia dalseonensis]